MNKEMLPIVIEGDLSPELAVELEIGAKENGLAVDIETTGLSPKHDSIQVVSLSTGDTPVVITLVEDRRPHYLATLLEGDSPKIFHHALFDLSFMRSKWDISVERVFCTKVAARIAGLMRDPTLQDLVRTLIGIEISKAERVSDWRKRPLSDDQVGYAATDVLYLHRLQQELGWKLSDVGRSRLFDSCMSFLPSRVELGLMGLDDVFSYKLPMED